MEPLNILLVGDTPHVAEAHEAVRNDPVVQAVSARTAVEALDHVARRAFGAILLDLALRDADPMEAAFRIRRVPGATHVPLMLLGSPSDTAQLVAALGPIDVLVLPLAPEVLRARLHFLADLQKLNGAASPPATSRRDAENHFRALSRAAPIAIFQLDTDGRCLYASPRWEATTGQPAASATGLGWLEALGPAGTGQVFASWRRAVAGERLWNQELMVGSDENGGRRWLSVKTSPVRSAAGRTIGHVGTVQDVTERHLAEEQRQTADRQKDEFLAMLAHELRNPLAAIGNAASVARTPGLEARRDWSLTIIVRQVGQLARLIDNLTDASRVTLGKIELHTERVDLAQALRRAVDAAQPDTLPRRQAVDIGCDEPLPVLGDPARLEQIFLNLLTNASRYSAPEMPIHVTAVCADGWVIVRVRDHGVGLEPAMLSRVFDLFVQAPSNLDRPHGGLGIGLSLARRLAELHGGTITAHSEGPGRGTEFVVRLPAAPTREEQCDTPEEPSPEAGAETTALVVDDNVDAAQALAILLESAGIRVVTAHDGEQALARVAEARPQFVLMDLGLPVLDGYEVASRMRARPELSDVVLVAVSGYGSEQDRRRSAAAGFDHHLVKPVDCAELLKLLRGPGNPRSGLASRRG